MAKEVPRGSVRIVFLPYFKSSVCLFTDLESCKWMGSELLMQS